MTQSDVRAQPIGIVDLRSDTVTRPTAEMRAAMAEAEVGDDTYGEDPTVNRLEALAAELMAKPAALYTPSGTMANQLAIRVFARPGTDVLCPDRAHVLRYEGAAAATNAGVQLRGLPDPGGYVAPEAVAEAIEGFRSHLTPVSMLILENTHMPAGGVPWDTGRVRALAEIAEAGGLPVHCDGARIFNAAIALGVSPADLAGPVTTVMFCLSKGLGAPVGSLLCGPTDVISEARAERHRLGGGMRQAGIIAAAGVVALETMVERLGEDHQRARELAVALAARFPHSVDPELVRTNIVCARRDALPDRFVADLDGLGIRCGLIDPNTVRLVTHLDVDDAGVACAIDAFDALVR